MSNPNPGNKFNKGNKVALGNDKTARLSTWIDKALDKAAPKDVEGYTAMMSARQALAQQLVDKALTLKDPKIKLDYIKEIADRTEGKSLQRSDVTSAGEKVQSVIFIKPDKIDDKE